MPQPYDYTIPVADPMGGFKAYEQGKQERRSDAFAQYLPGAMKGDQAAQSQAFENATPEQSMQLQAQLTKMRDDELQQSARMWDLMGALTEGIDPNTVTPEQWEGVKARAKQFGWKADMVDKATPADIPAYRAMSDTYRGAIKAQMDARQAEAQMGLTRANTSAAYASADASRALAGQRANAANMPKPLQARIQNAEDDDISAIQTTQSLNTQLGGVLEQLNSGDLELGPVNNFVGGVQNAIGYSTPGSQNLAMFQATLEKIRNDSLRLNKGVQTEGDAIRAWNEVAKNITDNEVVTKQLNRIMRLNQMAARQRAQMINIRRQRNNAEAFDFSTLETAPVQPAAPGQGSPPPSVRTQQEFDALPSGTIYIEPDGKQYKKP